MIQVNTLSKQYNGIAVLNIETLEIPQGQSFGLVGNNGAGKTTFFSLLLDLIQPSTGNIGLIMVLRLAPVKIGNLSPLLFLTKVF